MNITCLGTGSPVPLLDRAGTSLTVSVSNETLLIDCGPKAIYQLMENGINPADIETVFFTHQHMDHNAGFFNFAIAGWCRGRNDLTLYGPEGTERLVESLEYIYKEDLEYRKSLGFPEQGITDIDCNEIEPGKTIIGSDWKFESLEVDHSITTYAYRITDQNTGEVAVFSGDTAGNIELSDFASGADVLIHDCTIAPLGKVDSSQPFVWEEYTSEMDESRRAGLSKNHTDAREAAQTAADAKVDTLVLTHLLPYRDEQKIKADAKEIFDGRVIVAEDGLDIQL